MATKHQGALLRRFREERGLSLRESARQLHVSHPTLRDWEDGTKTPMPLNRQAIEVWTEGKIRADRWPLSDREREIAVQAGKVCPVVPAGESGSLPDCSETSAA